MVIFLHVLDSSKFSGFFPLVLRYWFETSFIHLAGSATQSVWVLFQSGRFDLLYSQKWVKVIFLHSWPRKLYRTIRFCTHTYIVSYICSQPAKSFPDFFVHVLRYRFETWYIHLVGIATDLIWVSFKQEHSAVKTYFAVKNRSKSWVFLYDSQKYTNI